MKNEFPIAREGRLERQGQRSVILSSPGDLFLTCNCCGRKANKFPKRGRKLKQFLNKTGIRGRVCSECQLTLRAALHSSGSAALVALQQANAEMTQGKLPLGISNVLISANNVKDELHGEISKLLKRLSQLTECSNALLGVLMESERKAGALMLQQYDSQRQAANYAISKYELRLLVFSRDGWKCKACGSANRLEIDHIKPVRRGGLSGPDNLQTLCKKCNSSKRDRWKEPQ